MDLQVDDLATSKSEVWLVGENITVVRPFPFPSSLAQVGGWKKTRSDAIA